MTTDPQVQEEVYRLVGEELARNEIHPGPMARAVAEAVGDHALIQSLYIKYRFEELYRKTASAEGAITCPNCGHFGTAVKKPKGDLGALIILLLMFVIPGIIYALVFAGFKGVCSKCGHTLIEDV